MAYPRKYKSPEEMQKKIDAYFEDTPVGEHTISGLCLYLSISKESLYNYRDRAAFKDIIERAQLRVEYSYEIDLRKKGRPADIFAMKNFGWRDRQDIAVDAKEETGVVLLPRVKDA